MENNEDVTKSLMSSNLTVIARECQSILVTAVSQVFHLGPLGLLELPPEFLWHPFSVCPASLVLKIEGPTTDSNGVNDPISKTCCLEAIGRFGLSPHLWNSVALGFLFAFCAEPALAMQVAADAHLASNAPLTRGFQML